MRGKRMIGTLTVGSGVMRRGQRFGFWLFPRLSSSGLVSLPLALSLLFSLLFYFNFFFSFLSLPSSLISPVCLRGERTVITGAAYREFVF